eukprot:6986233-Pyramimonas_sp.AAC.1
MQCSLEVETRTATRLDGKKYNTIGKTWSASQPLNPNTCSPPTQKPFPCTVSPVAAGGEGEGGEGQTGSEGEGAAA